MNKNVALPYFKHNVKINTNVFVGYLTLDSLPYQLIEKQKVNTYIRYETSKTVSDAKNMFKKYFILTMC